MPRRKPKPPRRTKRGLPLNKSLLDGGHPSDGRRLRLRTSVCETIRGQQFPADPTAMPATSGSERTSPMFDDAVRLIKILQIIPQQRWMDTREIAENLKMNGIDVPQRTLQRCLKTLREAAGDFGIECDEASRPLRYRWRPGASGVLLPQLTPAAAVLLRLADEALRQRLPSGPLQELKPLLRSARHTLSQSSAETQGRDLTVWNDKIIVTHASLPVTVPPIRPAVLTEAVRALLEGRILSIRFRRDTGRYAQIDLHPLGFVQHRSRTFLVGYEEPRGVKGALARIQRKRAAHQEAASPPEAEIGLYALHRMDSARVTLHQAVVPEGFDLENFVRRANFDGLRGRTIRLTIVTDSADLVREVLESPLCATQDASVDPEATPEAPLWRLEAVIEDSALLDAWLAERAEWILRSTKEQLRTPVPSSCSSNAIASVPKN